MYYMKRLRVAYFVWSNLKNLKRNEKRVNRYKLSERESHLNDLINKIGITDNSAGQGSGAGPGPPL